MPRIKNVNDAHLSEKAREMKKVLSIAMRENGLSGAITPVVRNIIFVHSPNTEEFWTETVPELLIEWFPEMKKEITGVLNPTIKKWAES